MEAEILLHERLFCQNHFRWWGPEPLEPSSMIRMPLHIYKGMYSLSKNSLLEEGAGGVEDDQPLNVVGTHT